MLLSGDRHQDKQDITARLGADAEPLHRLLDYWHGLRENGCLPARRHVKPEEIRSLLPYLVLYDVARLCDAAKLAGGTDHAGMAGNACYRFRVRLAGTHFVELLGNEISGRFLDEVTHPAGYGGLHERLAAVIDHKRPVFGIATLPNPLRDFIQYAHLTLPLAEDGERVDMLLGVRVKRDVFAPQDVACTLSSVPEPTALAS